MGARAGNEARFCDEAGIAFHNFPLPDRSIPGNSSAVLALSRDTYRRCTDGESTAIHCRAGIGRSSLIATAVMLHGGYGVDEALTAISRARGLRVPDTDEQRGWLLDYAAQHHTSS